MIYGYVYMSSSYVIQSEVAIPPTPSSISKKSSIGYEPCIISNVSFTALVTERNFTQNPQLIISMSSVMNARVYQIEPLNGTNYHAWRKRIFDILVETGGMDLVNIVTGETLRPTPAIEGNPTEDEKKSTAKWDEANIRARSVIRLRVDDQRLSLIEDKQMAAEAWNKLKKM